ncbi:MAG: flagellar basal body P-ring protein FlgI [Pirellulales bacterium]|nr:flagellar basal body P-ring protein FlgI [Pirellulales bacterium]
MKRLQKWTLATLLTFLCGCTWFGGKNMRSQSPDDKSTAKKHRLVGDLAVPYGLYPVRVEAIGFVTGLKGTGSDPAPSPQRTELIDEMRTRGVANPSAVLATNNTSLVLVQAVLRPGIQKGERFDLEFRVPSQSDTTSLRGGYLLETRLRELGAMADGRYHEGSVLALAEGPLLVDPSADPKKDRIMSTRGRVLGAGVALKSRPLGLVLKKGQQTIMNSSRVQNAVNKRFSTYEGGNKIGVAKAQTEQYIKLDVHPRYKDNINRYVQVVRSIAINETDSDRLKRIARLEKEIQDRDTAAEAALQLEALNKDGIPPLLKALESSDREVRFYAAEALAYLDRHEAVMPLSEAAREEPAFRIFALTALSAMQDPAAFEQLKGMLSMSSAETRYGAFRSLWTMNPHDPFVRGEVFGDRFHYHVLDVGGPAMIHVTRSRLPELVLFGKDQEFLLPITVSAGNQIIVKSEESGEITVSKFAVHEADQKRAVSKNVDEVVRAIVELGGSYPDVVQALQEAKAAGALVSRFEVDALPQAGRNYERNAEGDTAKSGGNDLPSEKSRKKLSSPLPALFDSKVSAASYKEGDKSNHVQSSDWKEEVKKEEKPGFFGKMKWWGSKKEETDAESNT